MGARCSYCGAWLGTSDSGARHGRFHSWLQGCGWGMFVIVSLASLLPGAGIIWAGRWFVQDSAWGSLGGWLVLIGIVALIVAIVAIIVGIGIMITVFRRRDE